MKLKLPLQYFVVVQAIMNQLTLESVTVNNLILQQWKAAAFEELRTIFQNVAIKNYGKPLDKKVSSGKIPESYLLLFFGMYNGRQVPGYDNVILKAICKQIEEELFKTGKYSLPFNY